jgi:hypothetical protein
MIPVAYRRLVAVFVFVLGVAQAFDSGLRAAPLPIQIIVIAAVLMAATAFWVTAHTGVQFFAGVACLVMVTVARVLSPTPLPTITLAGYFPCVAALLFQVASKAQAGR